MTNFRYAFIPLALLFTLTGVETHAEDSTSQIRPATKCFPTKDIAKLATKLGKIPDKHRDVISPEIRASFSEDDGRGLPERIFIRDREVENNLDIAEDGRVTGLTLTTPMPKGSELCIHDPKRALPMDQEVKLGFSMSVDIAFPRQDAYSLDDLEEGLEEGRVAYKKMLPGAVSFMVPKLTHVIVGYENKNADPQIFAMKNGKHVNGLTPEPFGKAWVIDVGQLAELGADQLSIEDEFLLLEPGTDIETMKRFGFSEAPENE